MAQKIRTLRHWKQRYDKNAKFIFRRRIKYGGVIRNPGDPIPQELANSPAKLRRFWESQAIELAEFEAPNVATGQVEKTEEPSRSELVKAIENLEMAKSEASKVATEQPKGELVEGIENLPEGVAVYKTGGPWFEVYDPEGDTHKVKGKQGLDELLDTLRALYGGDDGEKESGTAAALANTTNDGWLDDDSGVA